MTGQNASGLAPQQQSVLDALLLEAVTNKDLPHVKLYVEKGANVNMSAGSITTNLQRNGSAAQFKREATLLHHLYGIGLQRDVADYLIAQGLDVDARDAQGNTALMMAAKQGDFSGASYFLAKGADPLATNHRGDIVLEEARTLTPYYHSQRQQLIDALVNAMPGAAQTAAAPAAPVVELPPVKRDAGETALQQRLNKRFNP